MNNKILMTLFVSKEESLFASGYEGVFFSNQLCNTVIKRDSSRELSAISILESFSQNNEIIKSFSKNYDDSVFFESNSVFNVYLGESLSKYVTDDTKLLTSSERIMSLSIFAKSENFNKPISFFVEKGYYLEELILFCLISGVQFNCVKDMINHKLKINEICKDLKQKEAV